MYVRVKRNKRHHGCLLSFSLVEVARRHDGSVRQDLIQFVGSIRQSRVGELDALISFWNRVFWVFSDPAFSTTERNKFIAQVARHVRRPRRIVGTTQGVRIEYYA